MISDQLIATFFPKQFVASLQLVPEAPAAFSPAPTTVISHPQLVRKLQVARAKLQQADAPQMLKALSYLRISCNLMQKMQGAPLQSSVATDANLPYAKLVEALVAHDRTWWNHCTISTTGCLRSSDAVIDQLFSTIEEFHQVYGDANGISRA
jgi:hypothetical protein